MSGINIERESSQKNVNIKTNGQSRLSDINIVRDSSKKVSISDFKEKDLEENEDDMGINYFTNENKRISDDEDNQEDEEDEEEYEEEDQDYMMNERFATANVPEDHGMTFEEIQAKKAFMLSQLKRLESKGHVLSRRFGAEHSLEEISMEVARIKKEIEIESGIAYCKKGLMFFVSTIEMANARFDPVGAKLDGWSNVVMSEQDQYEEVFEELYEKYGSKVAMGPEIKLISMIAGSAFMFHLQKSLVDKAMNSSNVSESIANLMKKQAKKKDMKGPSMDTEEMLRSLDDSDVSDASSVVSEESIKEPKTINVPIKKRGRPKKPQ